MNKHFLYRIRRKVCKQNKNLQYLAILVRSPKVLPSKNRVTRITNEMVRFYMTVDLYLPFKISRQGTSFDAADSMASYIGR